MKKYRHLFFGLLLFSLASLAKAEQWHTVSSTKALAISGLAVIDKEHFLAVHDGKKHDHPRLSVLEWKPGLEPVLSPVNWCGEKALPIDLEAVIAIPGVEHEFLLLESDGKVSRLALLPVKAEDQGKKDKDDCSLSQYAPKIIAQFNVPQTNELEGLSLYCDKHCLLVWGERGKNEQPGKLHWGNFDIKTNQLSCSQDHSFDFKPPFPTADESRGIADIAIDGKGNVWVSATSDPGDDGPFQSAIYNIGSFKEKAKNFEWTAVANPQAIATYKTENVKIEALLFTPNGFIPKGLIMATDDENSGAKVTVINPE